MASRVQMSDASGLYTDLGPLIRRTDIAMVCLSAIFLLGRLYARKLSKIPLWWDDYLIIVALILAWACSFDIFAMIEVGLGKHTQVAEETNPNALSQYLKLRFLIEILYTLCLPAIKCSILLFYRRIFPTQRFRAAVHVVGAFIMCWFLSILLVVIFGCRPIGASWDPTIPGAHCVNAPRFFIGNAVLNIVGDITLLVMPMPMIWTLHLARSKKITLTAVFLFGTFALASSITRTAYLIIEAVAEVDDVLWYEGLLCLWTTIELNIGVIAACLPTMQPVLRHFLTYIKATRTQVSKSSWIGKSSNSSTQNSRPGTTVDGFCRLDDSRRFANSENPSLLSYQAHVGRAKAEARHQNPTGQEDDSHVNNNEELKGIHIKQDVSVSGTQRV